MRVRQFYCNKISSQNAPNCHVELKKPKQIMGRSIATTPDPSPGGEGVTPSWHPIPLGALFLELTMIRPHFLNRGYALVRGTGVPRIRCERTLTRSSWLESTDRQRSVWVGIHGHRTNGVNPAAKLRVN